MQRIFSSPHIIDVVLVLTLLEAIGLLLARRRFGRLFRSRSAQQLGPGHHGEGQTPATAAPRPTDLASPHSGHRAIRPIDIVLMLLPGLFLMLAIRAALDGAAWPWVPLSLAASLIAHLADLRGRWFG